MSKKTDKLQAIAQAIITDIKAVKVATTPTVEQSDIPNNGVYCSARAWEKNGKESLYPSIIIVSDKLYRGQFNLSMEQVALIVAHMDTLKAIIEKREAVSALLKANAKAFITADTVLSIVNNE